MKTLTPHDVQAARAGAEHSGRPLLEVLADALDGDSYEVLNSLADLFGYPVMDSARMAALTPAFEVLDYAAASQLAALLFHAPGGNGEIWAVLSDPADDILQRRLQARSGVALRWHLSHPADIAAFLSRHEEGLRALDPEWGQAGADVRSDDKVEELSILSISEDTSPVVKLVHSTLYDALRQGTSDIHLESTGTGLAIKYRIDGVLVAVGGVHGAQIAEQVISRIKVVSELDISETRTPQDGRMRVSMRGREIDLRVSIMPSIHGEDAVLRILDKKNLSEEGGLSLTTLGFDADSIAMVRKMSNEPYGMLLVTGPTGSGKTTTLYAALTEINTGQDKIITIEDPVEYQLSGILQIPVNERKGLTFARGLRSILRHDPDKIMVGEIRDPETAQIAIQSALTGHLVLTTVHANNVLDVIGRFMHMGIDLYSFVSAVNCIMAQRLVRLICPHCRRPEQPDAELLAASGLDALQLQGYAFHTGAGCGHCRGTGYKGRKAIAEIMALDDEIREMIIDRAPARQIREAARRNGTVFLREAALELVRSGQTTLREINRVTFVS